MLELKFACIEPDCYARTLRRRTLSQECITDRSQSVATYLIRRPVAYEMYSPNLRRRHWFRAHRRVPLSSCPSSVRAIAATAALGDDLSGQS